MSDGLNPGENLGINGLLTSRNGQHTLEMQGDGNLVLYRPGHLALWATNTDGRTVAQAIMQGDGNFVLYGPGGEYVWDTGTDGHPGSWLIIQDDGNVVIYDPSGNPTWATNTQGMENVRLLVIRARHDATAAQVTDAACQQAIMVGPNSLFGYWAATSQQYFDFTGSTMLPWVDISLGDDVGRNAVAALAIAAARALGPPDPVAGMDGILVLPFPGIRQIPNPNPSPGQPGTIPQGLDGGATTVGGVGTAVVPINTSDFTFLCHEVGHVLGFNHTFGLLNNGSDWNGSAPPLIESYEYGSPYDLMSSATFGGRWQGSPPHYNASPTFRLPAIAGWTGSLWAGPNVSRALLHFQQPSAMAGTVLDRNYPAPGARVYERVWAPDQSGRPTVLVLHPPQEPANGLGRVYVEYRPARGWDAGLGLTGPQLDRAGAVVHTVTELPNTDPKVWYRGSVPTGSIDRDLAVETTALVVTAHEDPAGNFVDIEVTVGSRPWVEVDQFDYWVRDSGVELPERSERTPCFDLVTVHSIYTVTSSSYRATATGLGGTGAPGGAVVLAWSVDGLPLTAASGQVAVSGSIQPIDYDIANDVLTLTSLAGQRVSAAVRATVSDGAASATSWSTEFWADGTRTWMSEEDRKKVAACKRRFDRWMRTRIPWLRIPIPDPPPLETLVNPALEIERWKQSVRLQFERLPGLTEADRVSVAELVELQVVAVQGR